MFQVIVDKSLIIHMTTCNNEHSFQSVMRRHLGWEDFALRRSTMDFICFSSNLMNI